MSKLVPAVSGAYPHREDIDPNRHFDGNELSRLMDLAVARAVAALDHPLDRYSEFQRRHLQTLFLSMKATHATIRHVLHYGWQDPRSIDALSLGREPLEILYMLCLMFEDPEWVDAYLKEGWKKQYEQFLLQREETRALARYDAFSRNAVHWLDAHRRILGITDAQKATIEHVELGTPMPAGMIEEEIPHFPPVSRIVRRIPAGDKRRMLERLYPEYVFFCSFVHGLPDAMLFRVMFSQDQRVRHAANDDELRETFHRWVEQPPYLTSLISAVQSASELTELYPRDVDLRAAVIQVWDRLTEGTLIGRAIWDLRTRRLLGIVGMR